MDLENTCIGALASHISSQIGEPCHAEGNRVMVPKLGLEFVAHDVSAQEMAYGSSVSVVFEAKPPDADSGIRVLAVGVGATELEAAIDAGHQWAVGVFPVVVSYVLDQDVEGVETSPMIVGVQDTNEKYAWVVYIGPVVDRVYCEDEYVELDKGELDPFAAYKPIFDAVHPYAAHNKLMWIESFSAKYPDGEVDATCKLNNKNWVEGRNALLNWSSVWPDTKGNLLSKRQFLIFKPTAISELQSKSDLEKQLDEEMNKSKK